MSTQLHNVGANLWSLQLQIWDILHVEENTGFPLYTLVVHTEEEFQQLTEKEEAVLLTVPQKDAEELLEGLIRIQLHNERRRQIHRRKRGRIGRKEGILFKE